MERPIYIDDARIFDGTGADPFDGAVVVEGNRIGAVMARAEARAPDGAVVLDAGGAFLMPGLVEGHAHPSFTDVARGTALGELPPEDHALATLAQARKLLDAGFTSACSAASAKIRLDVAVRDAIEAGHFAGPRLLAASPEITVTGGLGDARRLHLHQESFGLVVDGADDMRKAVRLCLREGVDIVKLNISGDHGTPHAGSDQTLMTDAEIGAAVETAHAAGRRVAAHARASESVKRAVRHGIDIIYHCDFADEEALDLLESVKERVFTGPAIGIVVTRMESLRGRDDAASRAHLDRLEPLFEASCRVHREMHRRGIRIVVGGDYGFAVNRQGTNARDLEHFVRHFGFSPAAALVAATRTGAEIMLRGADLGRIKAGCLADLLLVDGDPLDDVTVLQDRDRLALVMKDGIPHRGPLAHAL